MDEGKTTEATARERSEALREVLGRTEAQLLGTPLDAVLPGAGNPPGEDGQYTSHTHSSDGRELEHAGDPVGLRFPPGSSATPWI